MKQNKYLFYSKYIKSNDLIKNKEILMSKTNNSFLIGPIIDDNFDNYSFYKRLISNSIYSKKIYKNISSRKCKELIEQYEKELSSNEVIEVFRNNKIIRHKIIELPKEYYGKK